MVTDRCSPMAMSALADTEPCLPPTTPAPFGVMQTLAMQAMRPPKLPSNIPIYDFTLQLAQTC